jgi:hypothetical protein
MRRFLTIAAMLACFGITGTASAQSGQGGYLGLNPGKGVGSGTAPTVPAQGAGHIADRGLYPGGANAAPTASPAGNLGPAFKASDQPDAFHYYSGP